MFKEEMLGYSWAKTPLEKQEYIDAAEELAKTFDAMKPDSYYSIHCIAINPDDFIVEKVDWSR